MGRQPQYSVELLLDAAAAVAAAQGPGAVTMSAVATAAGAPSGSVYHRFPDRPSLQAALWLRVTKSFHAEITPCLQGEPVHAAVRSAGAAVRWCRDHHDMACVLLAGREALQLTTWSPVDRALADAEQRGFERRVQVVARELKRGELKLNREQIALAVFDLPYAAVRRHLSAGRPIPRSLDAVVESAARALLEPT